MSDVKSFTTQTNAFDRSFPAGELHGRGLPSALGNESAMPDSSGDSEFFRDLFKNLALHLQGNAPTLPSPSSRAPAATH